MARVVLEKVRSSRPQRVGTAPLSSRRPEPSSGTMPTGLREAFFKDYPRPKKKEKRGLF